MVLVSKPKRHAKPTTKQREGRHHKHSEPYVKTYWPYLPLLLIVVLGVALSNFWAHSHKTVLGYASEVSVTQLLQGTNDQRVANGLPALSLNSKLIQAAQAKADDMSSRDYWSHNTPEGSPPWVFFTNAGYNYQTAGENLAYGFDTSAYAISGWMASPGHKANILNSTYTEVGFGYANSANYQGTGPETIIVAEYGSPQVLAAAPANTPVASASPTPAAPPASTPLTESPAASTPVDTPTVAEQSEAKPVETNTTVPLLAKDSIAASAQPIEARNVSRIQLFASSDATWTSFAISAFAAVCICLFLLRHALFWHRALVKGEAFFIHHKLLDVGLVAIAVVGFVLTRTAGVIH